MMAKREEAPPRAPAKPDPKPQPDGNYHVRYVNLALGKQCIIAIPPTFKGKPTAAALYAGATIRSDWKP